MMKQTLIAAAAALTMTFAFGATQADAGYGYGYSKKHSYGSHYKKYSYKKHCVTKTEPVTIRVWDDYTYSYIFRTVYRDRRVCY